MPIPTKLFDVINGNGAALDVTYPRGVFIAFKDNAAKNAIEDAFATMRGYQATIPDPANPSGTIPNPQNKQQFFQKAIEQFIRDVYKSARVSAAARAASETAATAVDTELS